MDLDMLCKKPQFKRTRSVVEREEVYTKVQRYKRKLNDLLDYCKRLKELRVKNGYTQGQIAFILHTRQEQYSKYENGKRELPLDI